MGKTQRWEARRLSLMTSGPEHTGKARCPVAARVRLASKPTMTWDASYLT